MQCDPLATLRKAIDRGAANAHMIDAEVTRLGGDARAVAHAHGAGLLKLLRDDAADDSGMWTLVHAAEAADDDRYVASLLEALPTLAARAPGWGRVLLHRVFNHAASADALRVALPAASADVRALVASLDLRSIR